MHQSYREKFKGESIWLIAQSHAVSESLAFYAKEAGRFTIQKDFGDLSCGREGYVILYSLSGTGELRYGEEHHILPAHRLAMIDCRRPYKLRCASHDGEPWSFTWLRFDGTACDSLYATVTDDAFASYQAEDPPLVEAEFARILALINQPGVEACLKLNHSISQLMIWLVDLKCAGSPKRKRHLETISRATAYIQEHYHTALDIDHLAKQAQISKYYFIKLFKDFMGSAPYEYIILYRINEAKKYLRVTGLKVSQVSEAVGFNDECNFIRTFKRFTGFTPLQYRDHHR
jgi:AraC-like DNA-binding protein